ncbi:MAG TPA: hypothetical protein DDW52_30400 [Planctomycetaceae bacterium]|nr:hypothetical protein [Planctomycetaceae bacterium]
MAVVSSKLTSASGQETADGVTYELGYHVVTDARDDGPFIVQSATGWSYGDVYSIGNDTDTRAIALSVTSAQVSEGHYNDWQVDVGFGVPPQGNTSVINPLLDDVQERVNWAAQTRQTFVDGTGAPILNPAGDPYADGIEAEDNLPTITYSLNQSVFPFATAMAVRNAVNSSAWKGLSAGTVKVDSMTSDRQYSKWVGVYYSVSYTFAINPDGFDREILARGFRELDGGNATPIFDAETGQIVREPQMLDAAGALTTTPYFQTVELYPELDFNSLFPFL